MPCIQTSRSNTAKETNLASVKSRRVFTEELEKLARWLALKTKRCAGRMTRTTKISTVQILTAAPDWKRRFFIGPDFWCETQKESHRDTNTHCIDPHPCGQSKPGSPRNVNATSPASLLANAKIMNPRSRDFIEREFAL